MSQPQITKEIVGSQLKMVLQVERGTFIVPSFDEIWPQAGKERLGKGSKRMGMEYILEVRRIVLTPAACVLFRLCSTMALDIFHNQITSPLVDAWE